MRDPSKIWTGKAVSYDRARPAPPPALLDLLTRQINLPHPTLVVDLGNGTGLSTALWSERAARVIGIEPNADMRQEALHKLGDHPYAAHIEYRDGVAQQTNLPDECADIVTAAQAFHWMEPTATLAEIARILRPGGLFAAYDYDSPPAIHWELDRLATETTMRFIGLMRERGLMPSIKIWPQNKSLDPLRECGHFRFTREVFLHHVEQGDATRFLEMMQSGAFNNQFQFSDQETGFDNLKSAAHRILGSGPVPWYFSYRVRIGIK
ncbi:class I SAM-dependent methyltransferase [Ktedonosporobacter rubrisoli]|uniref:Class I SAM-dependent methyltransferase n=1 Tax=Ktedonosporobacter rubrisoli TaxID=2509675 RepID=A0A4P6JZ95_KTERU|nr:class I SAM-dependent methyltransferase [Ktedonosporobacter rubrisoli]QBD81079.1 class I SAM-dependent methyltransferase [Ktedonosporobacter rubrisoli]